MNQPDIVIIGAGIIGLSLAWRLAQGGARLRVLDAGARAGLKPATHAAAGMLAPSFETASGPLADALFEFSRESLALWRGFAAELEDESGVTIDYRADGVLAVAATQAEVLALSERGASLARAGVRCEHLAPEDIKRREPALRCDLRYGLFASDDGEVDPRRVLTALTTALARRGVRVDSMSVDRINERQGRIEIAGAGHVISAPCAILAAGSCAGAIVGALRSGGPVIVPVKGEALALAAPSAVLRHVTRAENVYLCPKADGRIVIGATSLPGDASPGVDGARIADLRAAAEALCPALRGLTEIERWSGLRPATVDGAPVLGRDSAAPQGLVYALGHYRNGVLLAPATARTLAELTLTGESGPALAHFAPDRFRSRAAS